MTAKANKEAHESPGKTGSDPEGNGKTQRIDGEQPGAGAGLLAVYSLGLAIPFWIAAGFSGAFMSFLVRFRRHLGTVEKAMGGLLVLTGLAFIFGYVSDMAIWFQQTFPILMKIG